MVATRRRAGVQTSRAPEMVPTSRMAARLADLSHAQLVEIAAAGCDASTEVKNRADALLAAHKPLAQWAVEGVLLSSDLVPHLLAPLQLEGVGSLHDLGRRVAPRGRDLHELRVRQAGEARRHSEAGGISRLRSLRVRAPLGFRTEGW